MSNKYEKFDNEFGLLPAEHENVNISKQKNGGLRTGSKLTATQLGDPFSDDRCAVKIITNCNGKKRLNQAQSDTSATNQPRTFTLKTYNEFDSRNLQKLSFNRRKWRFYLEQIWFRLLSISLIITYCILTTYDVFIESKHNYTPRTFEPTSINYLSSITPFMTLYFGVEVCLRIYASGLVCLGRLVRVYILINLLRNNEKSVLFKPSANETDEATKAHINIDITKDDQDSAMSNSQSNNTASNTTDNTSSFESSNQISQKVKRLITPAEFKLDIVYIKDNLIVLPCPVDNLIKFKRNQIKNLESFLDTKYGLNYKVYNLCSEQTYMDKSKSKYFHGNYLNFPIENYGILKLSMMKEFVVNLDTYLNSNPQAIAVVHCNDGKKRTSLVICAWLLYKKYFEHMEDAQRFFYEQLSSSKSRAYNLEINPVNYNLLQTPSQLRYLKYFEQLVRANMERPREQSLHLNEMRITSLIGIGQGNGSDLYCVFQINQFEQFHMNFFQENTSDQFNTNLNCRSNYNSEQDVLTICPINCPPLTGDILVRFFSKSRSRLVPKPHQHCAFYFWFNTDYLNETQMCTLRFDRLQLDNAHESNLHNIYRERFGVELVSTK